MHFSNSNSGIVCTINLPILSYLRVATITWNMKVARFSDSSFIRRASTVCSLILTKVRVLHNMRFLILASVSTTGVISQKVSDATAETISCLLCVLHILGHTGRFCYFKRQTYGGNFFISCCFVVEELQSESCFIANYLKWCSWVFCGEVIIIIVSYFSFTFDVSLISIFPDWQYVDCTVFILHVV